ncbi:type III pantothenate kinase [Thalassolituus sp. LLYu03]|uniref:type III pantothenate kinase n=1 Tax=Thalassolituus sp. LLYu03 TaxID=3421656 RepID=UPI003D2CBE09
MSVLLIDAGNSRIKWQLREQGRTLRGGSLRYDDQLTETLPQADKVLVAAVCEAAPLREALADRAGVTWLDHTPTAFHGFTHCYPDPSRLGVDRWLAMLGARRHQSGPLLVVDAGTALTIDLVSADNQHQGGFIVPGLGLAAGALFSNTSRVRPFDNELHQGGTEPGQDTLNCVLSGVKRQQQALVASVVRDYPEHALLLTGGDGQQLADSVGGRFIADLVFDGMDSLCAGSSLA